MKSARPSSRRIFGQSVASASSCGTASASPAAIRGSVATRSAAPSLASRAESVPASSSGADRRPGDRVDRTRVHPRLHPHDRHAGLRVSRQQRRLDGRGAAPARQDRAVDVHAAEARQVEDALREDLPVGDDDEEVRVRLREPRDGLLVLQRRRLEDGNRELAGAPCDRRVGDLGRPPHRLRRLRDGEDDVVPRGHEGVQRREGEVGGAEEDDAHAGPDPAPQRGWRSTSS